MLFKKFDIKLFVVSILQFNNTTLTCEVDISSASKLDQKSIFYFIPTQIVPHVFILTWKFDYLEDFKKKVKQKYLSKMTDQLSDKQIDELKEAFGIFDKSSGMTILLKYIGHNPSEEETKALIAQTSNNEHLQIFKLSFH